MAEFTEFRSKDHSCISYVDLSKTFKLSTNFCPNGQLLPSSRSPDLFITYYNHSPKLKEILFIRTVGFTHGKWTKQPNRRLYIVCLNLDLSYLFSIRALQCFTSFSPLTRLFHQTELPASLNEVQLLITLAVSPSLHPSLSPTTVSLFRSLLS